MLTFDELELRREVIAGAPELRELQERLLARAREVVRRGPVLPAIKGMLTADGGVCPEDRSLLTFDPWSPSVHRCGRCGREYRGERHDWRWAWHQHLWYAERIAEAAIVGLLADDEALIDWAGAQLLAYRDRYVELPNRDNVLGPSRLFSSTYLESVWLTNYLAAAFALREAGRLGEENEDAVSQVVEEAANLIGEFDEGLSNRQTWHNAALAAAAVWFGDEELAARSITGPRGLVGHLVDGFRGDGLWYEGENYHLFALRGLLVGAAWARQAGMEFFQDEASRAKIALALQAPALTALPTGEFPARKDSRFGVSLAQPMYLELWEAGIAGLVSGGDDADASALGSWLHALYALPAPPAQQFDSWLHEAGERAPESRSRAALSWWMLCAMLPGLPGDADAWKPGSVLLGAQGLAILRGPSHYASVECGPYGGGHGHPDRLHLTLHAGGTHWLADPGTGSYVSRDLFWYRSTLAHNAPRLEHASQPEYQDARADMFEEKGRWAWVRGSFDRWTRTVVAGANQLADIVEFAAEEEHTAELAWHPLGKLVPPTVGRWEPGDLGEEFVQNAERYVPAADGPVRFRATFEDRHLDLVFDGGGEIWRGLAPGRPGDTELRPFLLRRSRGRYVRFATVLRWAGPEITAVEFGPSQIAVETQGGSVMHRQTSEGWDVEDGEGKVALRGARRVIPALDLPSVARFDEARFTPPVAGASHLLSPPALDGTLAGFGPPAIALDHDDQYRRSEEPYPGGDALSARIHLGWDESALYVAADVVQPEPVFRAAGSAPLQLDNEPDLIHSDGLQLQLRLPDGLRYAWVISPDAGSEALLSHTVEGSAEGSAVRGAWRRSGEGYTLTAAITLPGWPPARTDGEIAFDVQVNEMRPGRLRRAGQLVWTGGGGWVYLRGDRGTPERTGWLVLE
ncbi:MAG: heparinase II/III family protein [Gemmatimonadales bacterium]